MRSEGGPGAHAPPPAVQIGPYDNPEAIRVRKYATGTHVLLEAVPAQTGPTPRELVWSGGPSRLYRYAGPAGDRLPVPVLLVYALINRPYILDLVPGNSLVEYLLDAGFDVYLFDPGVPGEEDAELGFEEYVLDYLGAAVDAVTRTSGAEALTMFGYCQGGTMSAMYAALHRDGPLRNLVLLATPVDFAAGAPVPSPWIYLGIWSPSVALRAAVPANVRSDVPGRVLAASARALAPAVAPFSGAATRRAGTSQSFRSWLAVCTWVDDGIPFARRAYAQWIGDFYRSNKLPHGEIELRGRAVELSSIRCSVLNVAGLRDTVAPLPQVEPTVDLLGSEDAENLLFDAGHLGLMASPLGRRMVWPALAEWLRPRSA